MNALQQLARRRLQALETRAELLARRIAQAQATSSGPEISYGEFEYEQNAALVGDARWSTLAKMETDPRIAGALRLATLPLKRAKWSYRAASDDPRDKEIAAFCNANLLRLPSTEFGFGRAFYCRSSWVQRLGEILDFLPSGRSVFVTTLRPAPGLKQVFDRIQWLEPRTISGTRPWNLDATDQIVAIQRSYTRPDDQVVTDETIEAARVKLYVWELKGARYDGRPYTRPMYGPWFRKDFLARMAAIWAQKVGAPAPVGFYPQDWDPDSIAKFEQFVQALRGSAPAHAFGVFPFSANDNKPAEVHYAGADAGEVDRMRAPLDWENAEIAAAGGSKSLLLGETSSGSRALGDSMGLLELVFVEAVAQVVIEQETSGVENLTGVVEELVERNYSNVEALPTLTCSEVNPFFLVQIADKLAAARAANLIPDHPEVRRQVSKGFGLDLPEDAFEEEEPAPTPSSGEGEGEGEGGEGEDPDGSGGEGQDPGVEASSRTRRRRRTERLARGSARPTEEAIARRIAELVRPMEDAPRPGSGFRPRA